MTDKQNRMTIRLTLCERDPTDRPTDGIDDKSVTPACALLIV